jgi:hypothetical protein
MARQALTRTWRSIAPLAAALLVLAGLTSCSPVRKGITGLTVDADGRPLAALAWCADRPPDVVRLFTDKHSTRSDAARPPADGPAWPGRSYDVPRNATSPTTVPLQGFPPESAGPDAAFRMYAVADDSSFTSHAVDFHLAQLAGLQPGSILITTVVDNGDEQKIVSLDELTRRGRDEC